MKILLIIIALTFFPKIVFAAELPILLSPAQDSTINSSKLEWQKNTSSIQYKIIIDDEPTATSPYFKPIYYTENNYYSPQLPEGTYYWKVAGKDSTNTWSEWSSIWKFTLSPQIITTPDPTTSTTPSPTTINAPNVFQINNVPTKINSDQSFKVNIELRANNNPKENFYLKGAFKKPDSSNYFGQTLVGSEYIKNGEEYGKQFSVTISGGGWEGELEVKPDADDSGFTNSGTYIFKVAYYKSNGSGPTWSNETNIEITKIESKKYTNNSTRPIPLPTPSPSSNLKSSISKISSKSPLPTTATNESSVAGVYTSKPSPTPKIIVEESKQFNFIPLVGGSLVLAGLISLGYLYLKNRLNHPV